MPLCCVWGCSNTYNKSESSTPATHLPFSQVYFYLFPNRDNSPQRHKSWLNRVNRHNFVPSHRTRVCSSHFNLSDFDESTVMQIKMNLRMKNPTLNKGAVPSLSLKGEKTMKPGRRPSLYATKRYVNQMLTSSSPSTSKTPTEPIAETVHQNQSPMRPTSNSSTNTNEIRCQSIEIQCELGTETLLQAIDKAAATDFMHEDDIMSETENEGSDSLFSPANDDEMSTDDSESSDCESEHGDSNSVFPSVFFVFWECLKILFVKCMTVSCSSPIITTKRKLIGSMLIVKIECLSGHTNEWKSQFMNGKQPIGNVLLASNLMLSGLSFLGFQAFCSSLRVACISRVTFDSIIRTYVSPVLKFVWQSERDSNINSLRKSDRIWLAGDGQYDSPGHCAKYCTYSLMDIDSQKIVDFMIVQRVQVIGDLEKAAFNKLVNKLKTKHGLSIDLLLTDRHLGIAKSMREDHPELVHEFDVWHLCKSLLKKLKLAEKKLPLIAEWKHAIYNHLWWSCMTCDGDDNILLEKFHSVLKHITNQHVWNDGDNLSQCEHPELDSDATERKKWIVKDSDVHSKLEKIILDKRFNKDLRHAKNYCHTGQLESYHNVRLKYMPKRTHFSYNGMNIRSIIAALDHNHNVDREPTGDT